MIASARRLAPAAAATSIVLAALSGCSGGSSNPDSPTVGSSSSPASSSPGTRNEIGHRTQFVVKTSKPKADKALPRIRKMPGVFLAAFEPTFSQVRVFFRRHATFAERAAEEKQIKKLLG